ncbi:glycosyltransferase family 39 protein [Caulobacter sp. 17J80-11]|uniref:ArnT family glycosyltransferase n=1 Tax=Caulobacter sp. 17J80-11 TaxID=2763502 RepID=UPI0016534E45|nr:glycosyltransferase family 39 protein [Caulobacter sp. 17J80-11]MBC6983444.1 glycosyltransferase family 39 protein [Caulobacter sp. 17J80-11]
MYLPRGVLDVVGAWRTEPGTRRNGLRDAALPLAGIVLVAALLRFYSVTQPLTDAFSWREASTAMMADNFHQRNWNVLFPEVSWTGPGPSYQGREFQVISYITALLYAVFGWHDWFGRAVAAGFGLWSVVALHRLVDRLFGRAQAHAAALTLALMPGAVMVDSSFLPDPAMLAFALSGLWALVAWLQNERPWQLPLAAALVSMAVLAKPPGAVVLVPAAYACASLLSRRGAMTRERVLHLVAALAAAAVAPVAYFSWAVWLGTHTPPYHVAGAGFFWDHFGEDVRALLFIPQAAHEIRIWFLTFPFALLAAVGLFTGAPKTTRGAPWIFHAWLLGCAGFYVLAAREITSNPWNLMIFAPPFAGLAGRGLVATVRAFDGALHTWPARARIAAAAVLLTWASFNAVAMMKRPYSETSRHLGQELARIAGPDDLVVTAVTSIGDPIGIYYSRRRGWVFPPGGGSGDWRRLQEDRGAIAALERLRAEGADWFGVTRDATDSQGRKLVDFNPRLIARLDRIGQRVVDDERVVIWRLPPVTPSA